MEIYLCDLNIVFFWWNVLLMTWTIFIFIVKVSIFFLWFQILFLALHAFQEVGISNRGEVILLWVVGMLEIFGDSHWTVVLEVLFLVQTLLFGGRLVFGVHSIFGTVAFDGQILAGLWLEADKIEGLDRDKHFFSTIFLKIFVQNHHFLDKDALGRHYSCLNAFFKPDIRVDRKQ